MRLFGVFVALLLVGLSLCSSHGQPSHSAVQISSCRQLRRQLARPSGNAHLVLTRSLQCTESEWRHPVQITGRVRLQGNSSRGMRTLDLTMLDLRILSIEPEGQLILDRLVLPDRGQPMADGFHFSFARVKERGSISVVRSYVIHPFCPENIHTILYEGRHKGRYHICGTRVICGGTEQSHYTLDAEMQSGCRLFNLQGTQQDALDANSGHHRPIKSHIVVIVLTCFLVAFFVLGVTVIGWNRYQTAKERALASYFPQEEKSSTASESTEKDFPLSSRLIAIDDFAVDLDHQLGVGGFGTVYAGRFQNRKAAVKVIKPGDVPDGGDINAEGAISVALAHPNVVMSYATRRIQLKDLFGLQHAQGEDECALIFMEYCDKGELSRAIDRGEYVLNFQSLQPKMCAILHSALDIAKGLQYIHAAGIVHGDIKPDNILRKTDNLDPRGYICKICDFGLSKRVENAMTKTDTLGMISYMPPEMLRMGHIGRFTDVYSFGMLLWEMVTSDVPYSEVGYNEILQEAINGKRPAIPDSTPPTITSLIKACWNSDYNKRPTSMEIIRCLHCALAEWYSSFPAQSVATPTQWRLRSPFRGECSRTSSIHPESVNSDTMVDEVKDEKTHNKMMRTCSTHTDLLQSDPYLTPTSTVSAELPRASRSHRVSRAASTKRWVSDLRRTKYYTDLRKIRIDGADHPS